MQRSRFFQCLFVFCSSVCRSLFYEKRVANNGIASVRIRGRRINQDLWTMARAAWTSFPPEGNGNGNGSGSRSIYLPPDGLLLDDRRRQHVWQDQQFRTDTMGPALYISKELLRSFWNFISFHFIHGIIYFPLNALYALCFYCCCCMVSMSVCLVEWALEWRQTVWQDPDLMTNWFDSPCVCRLFRLVNHLISSHDDNSLNGSLARLFTWKERSLGSLRCHL